MADRPRAGLVVATSLFLGLVIGWGTESATPWLTTFLGVSAVVVFGLGLGIVEGPTLISAIYLSRRATRAWVRSALQATAPFLGFFAYLIAYGLSRQPLLTFPFRVLPSGLG